MIRRVIPRMIRQHEHASTLVVALHGCTLTPSQRSSQLASVCSAVSEAIPDADILAPLLPIEFWSLQDADRVAAGVVEAVDKAWADREGEGRPYTRVLLVGFSSARSSSGRPTAVPPVPDPMARWRLTR